MVRLVPSIPAVVARCVPIQTQHATSVQAGATSCATSTQQPATPCYGDSTQLTQQVAQQPRNPHATSGGRQEPRSLQPNAALDYAEADLAEFDRRIVEYAELAFPNPEESNLKRVELLAARVAELRAPAMVSQKCHQPR